VTARDLRWCALTGSHMKPLSKDELFENLSGFLKSKGIELTDGSYAHGIQKSCSILADVINLGQQGLEKAKAGLDNKVDQVRQVIHEKTAPKATKAPAAASAPSAQKTEAKSASAKKPAAARPQHKTKAKRGKRG
jgi:hypothetical protein